MIDSRIGGFYRMSIGERVAVLLERGIVDEETARRISSHRGMLSAEIADRMIENVIGVFGLPFAIVPNLVVNGRDFLVPMAVEEPSIVAAVSSAAKLARECGGFSVSSTRPVLIGQVFLDGVLDADNAIARLQAAGPKLVDSANRKCPGMADRGGGVLGVEFGNLELRDKRTVIAVHFLVDTRDAMGANAVNSICESMAAELATIAGGNPVLKILSNLADRSLVTAKVAFPVSKLGREGCALRDSIVLANDIALADPYRAATHNKGIMNGMDAVAVATGNDWRALEAGAHAYAARDGAYRALTRWTVAGNGDLAGQLELPVRMGIVGGSLRANPAALAGLTIIDPGSSQELGEVMAAVGLAQNFAALRALATDGIQKGHMRLHARSVAAAAGVPAQYQQRVEKALLADGNIKEANARAILASMQQETSVDSKKSRGEGIAAGKIILLGEHAVVYGRPAVAVPIQGAVRAFVFDGGPGLRLSIPAWNVNRTPVADTRISEGAVTLLRFIVDRLGIDEQDLLVEIDARIPAAAGLGASAALAVAMIRAFNVAFDLKLDDKGVNALAFECEKLAHGTPSGIDNTLAVYGKPMFFKKGDGKETRELQLTDSLPLVVAFSGMAGSTQEQVSGVRQLWKNNRAMIERFFDEIGRASQAGYDALMKADYMQLGTQMNLVHGLLNALQVSTPILEEMVHLARMNGALGAKLTGAGGGGCVVALCPGREQEVSRAFRSAGFEVVGGYS